MNIYCVTWNSVPTLVYTSRSKIHHLSKEGCSSIQVQLQGCVIVWETALGRKLPVRARGTGNDQWGAPDGACVHTHSKSPFRVEKKIVIKWPGSKMKRGDFDFSKSSEKEFLFIRLSNATWWHVKWNREAGTLQTLYRKAGGWLSKWPTGKFAFWENDYPAIFRYVRKKKLTSWSGQSYFKEFWGVWKNAHLEFSVWFFYWTQHKATDCTGTDKHLSHD